MNQQYIQTLRLKKLPEEDYYWKTLPVIKNLMQIGQLTFDTPITFLVGENGAGKSTLLEGMAISLGFNPEGGSKNFLFSTAETHSELHEYLSITKQKLPKDGFFFRAESFYNVASEIDELKVPHCYGGKSLHKQSHGESFLSLVLNRFSGKGVYLLDEPEAALSPSRQMSLLVTIHDLIQKDSQFIIATHSPILLAFPNAKIYELTDNGIQSVSYKETDHYMITKEFLENPERMLHYLLEDQIIPCKITISAINTVIKSFPNDSYFL